MAESFLETRLEFHFKEARLHHEKRDGGKYVATTPCTTAEALHHLAATLIVIADSQRTTTHIANSDPGQLIDLLLESMKKDPLAPPGRRNRRQ